MLPTWLLLKLNSLLWNGQVENRTKVPVHLILAEIWVAITFLSHCTSVVKSHDRS